MTSDTPVQPVQLTQNCMNKKGPVDYEEEQLKMGERVDIISLYPITENEKMWVMPLQKDIHSIVWNGLIC